MSFLFIVYFHNTPFFKIVLQLMPTVLIRIVPTSYDYDSGSTAHTTRINFRYYNYLITTTALENTTVIQQA